MTDGPSIRLLCNRSEIEQVRPAWGLLANDLADHSRVGAAPGWAIAWLDTYADRASPAILIASGPSGLLGVLPLCHMPSEQTLVAIGGPLTDETVLLCAPEHRKSVCRTMSHALATLLRDELAIQSITLPYIAARNGDLVEELRGRSELVGRPQPPAPCPALPLQCSANPTSRELERSDRAVRWRKKLAYARRRVGRRFDAAEEILPASLEEFERVLTKMLRDRQHTALARGQWNGYHPWTQDAAFDAFLHRLGRHRGLAHITRLQLDDEQAAAALVLTEGKHVLYYCIGRNAAFDAYSPGLITLGTVAEWALEQGFPVLDLGIGDEPYKYAAGARDDLRRTWRFSIRGGPCQDAARVTPP